MKSLEQITAQLVMISEQLTARLDHLEQVLPSPTRGRLYSDSGLIRFEVDTPVSLQELENAYISYVLAHHDKNKTQAAATLGIDASTLYRKLERLQEHATEGSQPSPHQ